MNDLQKLLKHFEIMALNAHDGSLSAKTIKEARYHEGRASAYREAAASLRAECAYTNDDAAKQSASQAIEDCYNAARVSAVKMIY